MHLLRLIKHATASSNHLMSEQETEAPKSPAAADDNISSTPGIHKVGLPRRPVTTNMPNYSNTKLACSSVVIPIIICSMWYV